MSHRSSYPSSSSSSSSYYNNNNNNNRGYNSSSSSYGNRDSYSNTSSSSSWPPPPPSSSSSGGHDNDPLDMKGFDSVGGSSLYGGVKNEAGIDFDKYDDIPVETSGRDVPEPITTWKDSPLQELLLHNIANAGYTKPTPVQKYSVGVVCKGRDLMSCAQTGSGKTAAFLLPVLSQVMRNNKPEQFSRTAFPKALVITPTRELAIQIQDECRKFMAGTGMKSVVVFGGSPMYQQFRELERGTDLIVATPGRLVDIIEKRKISLEKIQFLVLDEADRMLDMGFEPQIRRIVEREGMPRSGIRQTLMFSATFPREIQQLAASFLSDYVFLTIGRVGSTTELVTQKFVKADSEAEKERLLFDLMRSSKGGLTLIFVETKKKANSLDYLLRREGFAATSIHGDRSQAERIHALRTFSTGQTPFLIATNVAARGLDISGVTHVINFVMPNNIDDYVHRIGRTGRAGKHGTSTSFIDFKNDLKIIPDLLEKLHDSNTEVPQWLEAMVEFKKPKKFGGNQNRFGGRDFRQSHSHPQSSHNNGSSYPSRPPQSHSSNGHNNGHSNGYGAYGSTGYNSAIPSQGYGNSYPTYPPAGGSSYGSSSSGYGAHTSSNGNSAPGTHGGYGAYGAYGSSQQNNSSSYGPPAPAATGKRDREHESYSDSKKPRYEDRNESRR